MAFPTTISTVMNIGGNPSSSGMITWGQYIQTELERQALVDLRGITYAAGDIVYHDGTNFQRLARGSAGDLLTINAAGTVPEWAGLPFASEAQAEAGTATDVVMTPQRTAQAVAALAPVSPIKAWAHFDGTATSPISPSGALNIDTITRNGAGDYTLTFATALPDANYAVMAMSGGGSVGQFGVLSQTASAVRVINGVFNAYAAADRELVSVIVVR